MLVVNRVWLVWPDHLVQRALQVQWVPQVLAVFQELEVWLVASEKRERKVLMDGSLALELDLIEGKLVKGSSSNQGRNSPTLGQPSQECSSACKTGRDKEKNEAI